MNQDHLPLADPGFVADPYPLLAALRARQPVFFDPVWNKVFFLRHADITLLLRERRLGRKPAPTAASGDGTRCPLTRDFDRFQDDHMLDNEPPKHTRLRRAFQQAFTPARVAAMRPQIERQASELLDTAMQCAQFDLLTAFAEPLPVAVIADLLGIPPGDRALLRPFSARIVQLYELGYSEAQARDANQAVVEFSAYLQDLIAQRRKQPGTDLISALLLGESAGEALSPVELAANCILLLNAGHEATVNAITSGMLALARHPRQRELLAAAARRGEEEFLARAVEELLRFDTPLPMFERWVYEDVAIGAHTLRSGQEVALVFASANRDGERFANPDTLDFSRTDNPHLSLGLGIHHCLGAALARLELQVAFATLLSRCPSLRLLDDPVRYRAGFVLRGHARMPVQWGERARNS